MVSPLFIHLNSISSFGLLGDFGNENYELVKSVAKIDMPKAAIHGNHDSWGKTMEFSYSWMREEHVGYGRLDFPALKVSVVGGRPFSCGSDNLFRKKLIKRFGVKTMEESADKIHKATIETPDGHSIIFLAHNRPTGLGSDPDDICGKDWAGGGDFGDPNLAQTISLLKENSNYHVPLVVFGHMHKEMLNGGFRKMISIGSDNTIYLNAVIVPRVKPLDLCKSRAFTVVDFMDDESNKSSRNLGVSCWRGDI
ncbi:uncharacterized protein LOC141633889 [Silene latifolia]|uniref:uncharacterized protein LOC141633889 n=1 Tax=Silene latifolia TaxID=37657 RepID=UPI003D77465D